MAMSIPLRCSVQATRYSVARNRSRVYRKTTQHRRATALISRGDTQVFYALQQERDMLRLKRDLLR